MSASEVLKLARSAGIDLRLDGDDLVLEAAEPPASEIIDLLSRNKREVLQLLRLGPADRGPEDWQMFFHERAAVAERQSGLSRPEAEVRAFDCCVIEWMNRNFVRSPPGQCLACAGIDHPSDVVLPFGVEPIGQAWLHSRCWPACHADREAEAMSALKAMGIGKPT